MTMPTGQTRETAGAAAPRRRALPVLLAFIAVDILLALLYLYTLNNSSDQVTQYFHLNIEKNIPSTYAAIKLVLAGLAALACIGVDEGRRFGARFTYRDFWLIIGTILILMGIDEYFAYHEGLGQLLYRFNLIDPEADTIGGYAWPWTVYGAVFVVAVGIPAAYYFWRMFTGRRFLFYLLVSAGFLFVLGALGFENYGVYLDSFRGSEGADAAMLYEELAEMVAVSLVAYIFIRYREERMREG